MHFLINRLHPSATSAIHCKMLAFWILCETAVWEVVVVLQIEALTIAQLKYSGLCVHFDSLIALHMYC